LNSADFLVDGTEFHLIEVNPRPGATLDVFDDEALPLLGLHLWAVTGSLAELPSAPRRRRAAAVLHARRPLVAPERLPDWVADRPAPGTLIATGDPVCTVLAEGPDARRMVQARLELLESALRVAAPAAPCLEAVI
jgi:predicted ATP-grasp superfamily ATP-dependent carboligase